MIHARDSIPPSQKLDYHYVLRHYVLRPLTSVLLSDRLLTVLSILPTP